MTEHLYEIGHCDPTTTANLLWIGGSRGVGLAHRDCFELLKDGATAWQAAIQWESFCSPFQSQLVWKEANAALFGAHDEIYALDVHTGSVMFHQPLGSYFGSFKIEPYRHLLFIMTGREILAVDEKFEQLWSTYGLAVDGVVFQNIGEDLLTVAAEMDPPGRK